MTKKRVMSGMRPTGMLHLGHWLGVLTNWVKLQHEYDCFFSVADWHTLTTKYEHTEDLRSNIREVLLDWLAAGVDPEKATLYVQSSVPELAELSLLLSMITPVPWLQRNPTVKDMVTGLHLAEENFNAGLLGYPVLMTADILAVRGELVPVGKDQLPHLELSRDIARRFNFLYNGGEVFFAEPKGLLTEAASLPGLDGRKMSKSYDNDIKLADSPEAIRKKVMAMVTDPGRQRRQDPGYPEVCTVFAYYGILAPSMTEQIAQECRSASIGCVQDKKQLAEIMVETLAPLQERRMHYASQPGLLDEIIESGNRRARDITREVLSEVRDKMRLPNFAQVSPLAR